jgi:3-oxoacyl-[acyl-carrier-protein] synthase-1
MAITSIRYAVANTDIDLGNPGTLFILSTTKGNIDLLGNHDSPFSQERVHLWDTARLLGGFFRNPNPPVVVSNACISGVLALQTAQVLLTQKRYKHAVVVGVDIASKFVVSGFQAFKAVSETPCKPYDKHRNGLSLGEGAATIILTTESELSQPEKIVIRGGASANDANHISGPSPTGEGLHLAIEKTLLTSGQDRKHIDFISAHGTATPYNDDMESHALHRSALHKIPVNSLKGFFGHTLGAAGVMETAVCLQSMRENTVVATKGFRTKGTAKPINVIKKSKSVQLDHCLKLASGFGGCNAGLLLSKHGSF